jgi:hypothetical protein
MKKILFLICLLAVCGSLYAQVPSQVVQLTFQVRFDDPTQLSGEFPRGTVNPPSACLDDHTLYISDEHSDYMLYLVDTTGEEPVMVYQAYVHSTVNTVVLPATLAGTYELQLYDGGEYYYYCEIQL